MFSFFSIFFFIFFSFFESIFLHLFNFFSLGLSYGQISQNNNLRKVLNKNELQKENKSYNNNSKNNNDNDDNNNSYIDSNINNDKTNNDTDNNDNNIENNNKIRILSDQLAVVTTKSFHLFSLPYKINEKQISDIDILMSEFSSFL